jgi:hypothetical protein
MLNDLLYALYFDSTCVFAKAYKSSWNDYSWCGSSLIYNGDIAARLCCPSELKKTREGERRPNANEQWLDTQARALYQASAKLQRIIKEEVAQ